jgi:hypothetical protein
MFAQDLFKPPIQLEKEIPVPMPVIPLSKDNPQLAPGTPLGRDGLAPTFRVNPGTSIRHIEPNQKPEGEIAVVVSPPNPDADW